MYERGLTVNEISNLLLIPISIVTDVIESYKDGEYDSDDFAAEFDIVTEEV